MAERRMFSKRLTNSARFIKMPSSTQNLYFHLGINADDDGIVEAYSIMNQINATEDDLRLLVAKNFVIILNDDLVSYIVDWRENNKLRADRKVDSIYKDLLLKLLPEVHLLEAKTRADRVKSEEGGTSQGQPKDTIGQSRLVQYSIEDRLDNKIIYSIKEKIEKEKQCIISEEKIKEAIIKAKEYNPYDIESYALEILRKEVDKYGK